MGKSGLLGGLEEMVLLALMHLGEEAYAVPVRRLLEARLDRSIAIGAVYATLDRLEEKDLAESWLDDASQGRRGRPRRYFRIPAAGRAALHQSAELRQAMWRGINSSDGTGTPEIEVQR